MGKSLKTRGMAGRRTMRSSLFPTPHRSPSFAPCTSSPPATPPPWSQAPPLPSNENDPGSTPSSRPCSIQTILLPPPLHPPPQPLPPPPPPPLPPPPHRHSRLTSVTSDWTRLPPTRPHEPPSSSNNTHPQ